MFRPMMAIIGGGPRDISSSKHVAQNTTKLRPHTHTQDQHNTGDLL
jgi:hypothetical protein